MPTISFLLACMLAIVLALATPPARADCITIAAARHHVNADVLRAIGWQESGLQPLALSHNANGSIDVGAFQINSVHLPELARYGIDRQALADGCVSADVAAWHYRRQIDLQGDGWLAVGAYHSHTFPRAAWYANRIATILMRWQVIPVGALPFPAERTRPPDGLRSPLPPSAAPPPAPKPRAADTSSYDAIAFLPPAR